jgi:hypothetical protein
LDGWAGGGGGKSTSVLQLGDDLRRAADDELDGHLNRAG